MKRIINVGIDVYCYVTFTTPEKNNIEDDMKIFVDRLQKLDENLPLRTVPLEIKIFLPTKKRLNEIRKISIENQFLAAEVWVREIENRFPKKLKEKNIAEIPLIQ